MLVGANNIVKRVVLVFWEQPKREGGDKREARNVTGAVSTEQWLFLRGEKRKMRPKIIFARAPPPSCQSKEIYLPCSFSHQGNSGSGTKDTLVTALPLGAGETQFGGGFSRRRRTETCLNYCYPSLIGWENGSHKDNNNFRVLLVVCSFHRCFVNLTLRAD